MVRGGPLGWLMRLTQPQVTGMSWWWLFQLPTWCLPPGRAVLHASSSLPLLGWPPVSVLHAVCVALALRGLHSAFAAADACLHVACSLRGSAY